jgi:hypothetical protein
MGGEAGSYHVYGCGCLDFAVCWWGRSLLLCTCVHTQIQDSEKKKKKHGGGGGVSLMWTKNLNEACLKFNNQPESFEGRLVNSSKFPMTPQFLNFILFFLNTSQLIKQIFNCGIFYFFLPKMWPDIYQINS